MENFIKELAIKAGDIVEKKFGTAKITNRKSHSLDLVTEADLLSNKYIVRQIKNKFPDHGIISEELGNYNINKDFIWIIDPIDGTINFAKGIPLFVVLIALAKKGKIILSSIYDPVHNELFFAKQGQGSFLNNKKIKCSNYKFIAQSTGMLSDRINTQRIKILSELNKLNKGENFSINIFSSIGISAACVASGRSDWVISVGGKIWDYAAPALLAEEAGCRVTNCQRKPWEFNDRDIIIANKNIHPILLKIVLSVFK